MLPLTLISFAGSLLCGIYFVLEYDFSIYSIFVIILPIPIFLFRFLQKKLSKSTSFIFKPKGILIENNLIEYSEIEGHHWDPNLSMDALNIKMKNGAIFRYTISKLDKPKENYKRFIKTFNSSIKSNTEIERELLYNEVHEKEVKFLKPLIIFGTIVFIGFLIFFLSIGKAPPYQAYMIPGLLIFLYTKAYK